LTPEPHNRRLPPIPTAIILGAVALTLFGALLLWRAESRVNHTALASEPKRVTVVGPKPARFRPSRRYVGTLAPWVEAKVGPQFISAYVDTVLVRPGATVKRGEVLATLDCRNSSAATKAVAMEAHALETLHEAIRDESLRIAQLQDGGFVSPNEVEQKAAESASKQAQAASLQAQLMGTTLQVQDCILKSPFDGDVAARVVDPGAFVRPGAPLVTVVNRDTVRLTLEVPEDDFDAVAPGNTASVHLVPTGEDVSLPISRRAPSADPSTRTVHVEIDLPNKDHRIPVYTTAVVSVDVGEPVPAQALPLAAAAIRGEKATLFVVKEGKAHALTLPVLGESLGSLYLPPSLDPEAQVVLEGRNLLTEGDLVVAKPLDTAAPDSGAQASGAPAP
jgi:RND family efflux transporter MFP subunit